MIFEEVPPNSDLRRSRVCLCLIPNGILPVDSIFTDLHCVWSCYSADQGSAEGAREQGQVAAETAGRQLEKGKQTRTLMASQHMHSNVSFINAQLAQKHVICLSSTESRFSSCGLRIVCLAFGIGLFSDFCLRCCSKPRRCASRPCVARWRSTPRSASRAPNAAAARQGQGAEAQRTTQAQTRGLCFTVS